MSPLRRAVLAVLVLGLAGCGLPVQPGIHSTGPVAPQGAVRGDIQVLPPGPRPGADAREIVLGFLGAQTSPDGGHALAREFLSSALAKEWDDRSGVVVYDPVTLDVVPDPVDEDAVAVHTSTVASIAADGGYVLSPGTSEDVYRVRRDERGELRLVTVPPGLRLTAAGAGRSFHPHAVYFLAPGVPGRPATQLVPDRVFLPVTAAPDEYVRRLLAGPSAALAGAVTNAFPPSARLRRPVQTADGALTVDLTGVGERPAAARRQLAAQLVWTLLDALPTASKVRLLADGRPFDVPDAGPLQDRSDWASFDPEGTAGSGAAVYIADRRLERLDGTSLRGDASDGRLPVDQVASSPSTGRTAVLTHGPTSDVVRVGPVAGPFVPVLERPHVTSLSFGTGERGLWLVASAGGEPQVLLVPDLPGAAPQPVGYTTPDAAGPLSTLRVSRDGARVAAVFGVGAARRLYVGRVEAAGSSVRIAGLRPVAPALADVADVAWDAGTSVVALAPLGTPNRLPVRVAIDGSSVDPVRTLGLDGEPQTVAAAPERPLVVGTVVAGRQVLLVEDNGLFRLHDGTGASPVYPG